MDTADARVRLETPAALRVAPSAAMIDEIAKLLGEGCVRVVGGISADPVGGKSDRGKWQKKPGEKK